VADHTETFGEPLTFLNVTPVADGSTDTGAAWIRRRVPAGALSARSHDRRRGPANPPIQVGDVACCRITLRNG
jgi:hypothetical protein